MMKRIPLLLALILAAGDAAADVARVQVVKRAEVGSSGYEKIVATVYFVVDPRDPRNRVIADLDRAATNAAGKVEFSADRAVAGIGFVYTSAICIRIRYSVVRTFDLTASA